MKKHRRLSKSEMVGFLVLSLVILIITLTYLYKDSLFTSSAEKQKLLTTQELEELELFSQQIRTDSAQKAKKSAQRYTKGTLTPFAFDPNTADSMTLSRLGLRTWQISNLLKYRQHGGRWKNADDFSKLYGLSSEEYALLRPYIKIEKTKAEKEKEKIQTRRDSIHRQYPKKLKEGTLLSLNLADTTQLKGIPGIGSYYAQKICRYRERLGGFISTEQLKEIEGLPTGIEKWFAISDTVTIRKTQINSSSFKELIRHPYLNYEQVKVICNYIRKYGKLQSWEELSNSEHFDSTDFARLKPYSDFK